MDAAWMHGCMDECMDRWEAGQMGCMDRCGWIDKQLYGMDEWMHEWMHGCMDECMDRCGWIVLWEGQIDWWMDGQIDQWMNRLSSVYEWADG